LKIYHVVLEVSAEVVSATKIRASFAAKVAAASVAAIFTAASVAAIFTAASVAASVAATLDLFYYKHYYNK